MRCQHALAVNQDEGSGCVSSVWCDQHVRTLPFNALDSSCDVHGSTPGLSSPQLLPFDHVLPDPSRLLERPPRTAILYATLDSPNFRELHSYLYAAAHSPSPQLTYVFRPIPPAGRDPDSRTYLSGYGVALDLKKTDYLAVDDRLQGSSAAVDEHSGDGLTEEPDPIVSLLQQYPLGESVDVTLPLTEQELLGASAASTSRSRI